MLVKRNMLVMAALYLLMLFAYPPSSQANVGGGRRPVCATLQACRDRVVRLQQAVVWQRDRRQTELAKRWHDDVVTAEQLASRYSGVSFARLWTISECESRHDPFNTLGQYEGLFQLGRYHRSLPDIRGLDPYNPYVNAMHAAMFIARHGESQWSCRSDGSVAY